MKIFLGIIVSCLLIGLSLDIQSGETGMARVEGGIYKPFYPPSPKEKEIPVKTFWMDKLLVTNSQFLDFVKKHSEWRRDKIKKIYTDGSYLSKWKGAEVLGPNVDPLQPVTQVNWFAAKEYCESIKKRLPTENEWEYAASASDKEANARNDLEWRNKIMDWYTRSAEKVMPQVGKGHPNFWGLYDMHELVWEWVLDFNSSLISADNRENAQSPDRNRFCGAGALVATEKDDYASFMRIAFRTSLKAAYTTNNLGFRCAADEEIK